MLGSDHFVLPEISGVIETARLRIGVRRRGRGNGCLGEDFRRDVVDRGVGDFVDEADVVVLARRHAGDDFAARDFRVDNRFAPAPPIVDHHDEILHGPSRLVRAADGRRGAPNISENRNYVKT